jgi:hypothetical protein
MEILYRSETGNMTISLLLEDIASINEQILMEAIDETVFNFAVDAMDFAKREHERVDVQYINNIYKDIPIDDLESIDKLVNMYQCDWGAALSYFTQDEAFTFFVDKIKDAVATDPHIQEMLEQRHELLERLKEV